METVKMQHLNSGSRGAVNLIAESVTKGIKVHSLNVCFWFYAETGPAMH